MPPSHSPSAKTPLSRRLNQWICGMHGHETQLQIGADGLLLRCSHCGYATPGWIVGRPDQGTPRVDRHGPSPTSSAPATVPAQ